MKDNVARLLLATLVTDSKKDAISDESGSYCRKETLQKVGQYSRYLKDVGVCADTFVLLCCGRGIGFWIELLSIWAIGAKPVCVDKNMELEHLNHVLQLCAAKFTIGLEVETKRQITKLRCSYDFPATGDNVDAAAAYKSIPFCDEMSAPIEAGLIFTSGTTGNPKGVPLRHSTLIGNALATGARLRLSPTDRLLISTPFRFISSISHFIVCLISGASFYGTERPLMPRDLIYCLKENKITAFGGSPFHMQFVAMTDSSMLPDLRWIMSSGDHARPALIEEILDKFPGVEIHIVYGMAELGGRFCELPPEYLSSKIGSVGYPISGLEFTIRGDDGQLCNSGEIGDIYVSGQLKFTGYYRNEEANQKVLRSEGFFNGDKGYVDEDGFLYLAGRSDSVFKRSGLKVSCQVVCEALLGIDGVDDAFVTSEDHLVEGRVPVAYLKSKGQQLHPSELMLQLRKVLPSNHIPARFEFVSNIPRTGSGKVDRRAIAKQIKKPE